MTAKPNVLSVLVLLLAAARTGHADAAKDFSTGSSVVVDVGTVVIGSPRTSSGSRVLAKARDSLDFTLRAEDIGLKLPVTIHFRGRSLGGGWVEYEIDDRYEKPIDLGKGHYLSRIAGHVYMRAHAIRGREKQTLGNTRLAIAGTSYVTAYGDWGEYSVPITRLALRGGVPQPALQKLALGGGLVCSGKETTHYPFAISLAGEATASGAYVELTVPRGAGLHLPPGIVILPGKQSALVDAYIQPEYVGTAHVTAAAGGVVQSLDVVVHPSGDCVRR